MAKLKLYYDLMSQPSRAVVMFCKLAKIPYEDHPVALRKGQMKGHQKTLSGYLLIVDFPAVSVKVM